MRLSVRYVDDIFVFFGFVDMSKIYFSVISGIFNNSVIRLDEIFFFGVLDKVKGGLVFDGVIRGYEFGFCEDIVVGFFREMVELDLWV